MKIKLLIVTSILCLSFLLSGYGLLESDNNEVLVEDIDLSKPILSYYDEDLVPGEIRTAANVYGEMYGIPPEILIAIGWHESRFREEVISANGKYYGLMQIHPPSHGRRMSRLGVDSSQLLTIEGSMLVAADYLAELNNTYGDIAISLMYYSGEGDSAVKRYLQTGKLSHYSNEIMQLSLQFVR